MHSSLQVRHSRGVPSPVALAGSTAGATWDGMGRPRPARHARTQTICLGTFCPESRTFLQALLAMCRLDRFSIV